jgi:hypothetical protein
VLTLADKGYDGAGENVITLCRGRDKPPPRRPRTRPSPAERPRRTRQRQFKTWRQRAARVVSFEAVPLAVENAASLTLPPPRDAADQGSGQGKARDVTGATRPSDPRSWVVPVVPAVRKALS